MLAFLWYTLKVSVCLIAFYSFYSLSLKRSTFFTMNRLFLVIGLLLSFIIPVLHFSIFQNHSSNVIPAIVANTLIDSDTVLYQQIKFQHEAFSINYVTIISVIYFIGVSVLFFKLLFSLLGVFRIKKNSETHFWGKMKIIKTNLLVPFSFFNMIFLPKHESNSLIIEHEKAHILQFHWFDLLIAEIASVLLWFNPFIIFFKNSLKLQHEYLADNSVISDDNQIVNYLNCLLKQVHIVSVGGPVSHFYCKTIKQRIIMITKNKTSIRYLGIYLLVIPLVCLLLFAFTTMNYKVPNVAKVKNAVSKTIENQIPSSFPVDIKKVSRSTGFGWRIHPIYKRKELHPGFDFKIPIGEKITSTANGIVLITEVSNRGYGNYIVIKHNEIYSTLYAHLQTISVKTGDKVRFGQTIGTTGNTGLSTYPHLHYEVIKDNKKVNPINYFPKN